MLNQITELIKKTQDEMRQSKNYSCANKLDVILKEIEEMKKETNAETPGEVNSLRWLEFNFPHVDNPADDIERMQNCINLYCKKGAALIEAQNREIAWLKAMLCKEGESNE